MGNTDKKTEAGNNKSQGAVIAALVVGLLFGFFIGRSWGGDDNMAANDEAPVEETGDVMQNDDESTSPSDKVESVDNTKPVQQKTTITAPADVTGSIVAADQVAGMTVAVSKVTLGAAGWVAVREDTGNGMGHILGAQWLPAGTHENVTVDLLRGTEANHNYFAVLYNDDGNKKFDTAADLPIAVDGKVVSSIFSAK